MRPLTFWLPLPNGMEREVIIPAEYVESIMIPAAEHEAGHIIAAHHYGARVFGIAVGFIPEYNQQGIFLQALYGSKDWSVETQCIVKAAGPAADLLYDHPHNEQTVSGDINDIEALTGEACLEPYLTQAKEILAGYSHEFHRMTTALHESMGSIEERTLGRLPDNRVGALLLDEKQLMECLA
jgi:hypothetical protein